MKLKLSSLLNIRPNEWSRFLILYGIIFTFVLGLIWGVTVVEAAFLYQVGVEWLPLFFIGRALLSVPAVAFYTAFADRVANGRLLMSIVSLGALGVLAGLVLLVLGYGDIAYPLLFTVRFVPFLEVFAAHWYTYVNGFYDTRAAKRIIPVLETSGILAAVLAGGTVGVLTGWLGAPGVVGLWLGTLLLMLLLIRLMPRLLGESLHDSALTAPPNETLHTPAPRRATSFLSNIREGYQYTVQSSFLRWLGASTIILMALLLLLQYRTSQVLVDELGNTAAIAGFLGIVIVVSNVVILPLQLFVISRLIGRLGLANATLIYPGGVLLACVGLVSVPTSLTAAGAYFVRNDLYFSFGYPINSLLYNAVPVRLKGRTRAFINGMLLPLGGVLAGLVLLTPVATLPWVLSSLILVLAGGYVVTSLLIRDRYSKALLDLLAAEDLSALLPHGDAPLQVTDAATLQVLRTRLEASTDPEFTVFLAQFLSQLAGPDALPMLSDLATRTESPRVRAAVLEIILTTDVRNEAVRQLYLEALADADPGVRQAAITGLEYVIDVDDASYDARLLDMVCHDPNPHVQVHILRVLSRRSTFSQMQPANEVLDRLLAADDPTTCALGVGVLGLISDSAYLKRLLDYTDDTADAVRLRAAIAIEALPDERLHRYALAISTRMQQRVHDPIERVRQAAYAVLGRLDQRKDFRTLSTGLTDSSPQVRETAVAALVRQGRTAIPTVHPLLDEPDVQLRKMAAVTLSRIDPHQFGGLIEAYITTGNLLLIYQNVGLLEATQPLATAYSGGALLHSTLHERNHQLIDEIFFLLTAVHDPQAVKMVTDSLHSSSKLMRANALEALEALTTPQTTNLIAPLFDSETTPQQLLDISRQHWDMQHPDGLIALHQLYTSRDLWLRLVTAFLLGEIGARIHAGFERQRHERAGSSDGADTSTAAQEPGSPDPARPTRSLRRRAASGNARKMNTAVSNALDALTNDARPGRSATPEPQPASPSGFNLLAAELPLHLDDIESMVHGMLDDDEPAVQQAARSAVQTMVGLSALETIEEDGSVLSTIERVIFLKEVPFFHGMTIEQLKALASVCEEQRYSKDTRILDQGDPGGALYVLVNGRVGLEQEKRRGHFARVATLGVRAYFGEVNLFDGAPHAAAAIAIDDTFLLRLRREPLIALARQYPELSLELIQVLSQRLREANDRIGDLTRSRPRQLHKLYDQFE